MEMAYEMTCHQLTTQPITTSGLIADDDDDGDGLLDGVETGTGFYINGQNTGTTHLTRIPMMMES